MFGTAFDCQGLIVRPPILSAIRLRRQKRAPGCLFVCLSLPTSHAQQPLLSDDASLKERSCHFASLYSSPRQLLDHSISRKPSLQLRRNICLKAAADLIQTSSTTGDDAGQFGRSSKYLRIAEKWHQRKKKKKEQIAAAAAAGGRKSKKKWSKGKSKDKLNNAVLFDKEKYDKLSEIVKSKLITPSVICERLKVNASCARLAIKALAAQGSIKPVGELHHAQMIYTRNTGA